VTFFAYRMGLLLQLNFFSSSGAGDLAQYIQHIGWMPWC
jgi:hypothetical protein